MIVRISLPFSTIAGGAKTSKSISDDALANKYRWLPKTQGSGACQLDPGQHWLTASCKFACTYFNNFSKADFFMLHLCLYNSLTEGTRKQLWVFTRANNLSQESYWSRHVRLRCFTYSYCLLYTSILTHILIMRYSVTPRCDCDRYALYI